MKSISDTPLFFLARMMWRYAEGRRDKLLTYIFLSSCAGALWAMEPLLVGYFLNEIQVHGFSQANAAFVLFLLSTLLLLDVVGWLFHGPARVMEMHTAFHIRTNYRKHLLQGTLGLPIEWHTDHHSGDTIDKIEKGSSALFEFSENSFQVIQAITVLVAGVVTLFLFDTYAALIVLFLMMPTFYVLVAFDKRLVPGYKRVSALENELSAKVYDAISNVITIVILRVEVLVLKALETAILKPFTQFRTNQILNESKWFSASILGRLAAVLVIAVYLWQGYEGGAIMIGTIYILYGYVDRIRNVFFQFAYLYNDIIRQRAKVSNAEILSKDFRKRVDSERKRLPRNWKTITIANLAFSYGEGSRADIEIASGEMRIHRGSRIALIGESGGGKSTFLKLLRDLYHPRHIKLEIDDSLMPEGFSQIENSIALIPQDPEIFATTIRENITLGVEYPERHIQVFTDLARFSDVVKRLPRGFESSIVEKGVNLSGGEKQRLALTRGLLASEHKDIILLDEPTSSVDFANELEIYRNIFESFSEKTIISSIHRLHLLPLFNEIYLFKNGRVVANGSFEDLKMNSKDFQELWDQYIQAQNQEIRE